MFTIRPASAEDLPILSALFRERHEGDPLYIDENLVEAMLDGRLPGSLLLSFQDETPVGYCCYSVYGSLHNARTEMVLDDIYVTPAYRKRYFGKLMLNTAVRTASELVCTHITFTCTEETGILFFSHCSAPEPVDGRYTVEMTGVPHLGEFHPTCGDHHKPF